MKNQILRILISAILLSLISIIVVLIIGFVFGWKTSIQFSDGFFWAGAIMIVLGFVSYQGYSQRETNRLPVFLAPGERIQLWAADTSRGRFFMVIFGISGFLLLGLSVIVSSMF